MKQTIETGFVFSEQFYMLEYFGRINSMEFRLEAQGFGAEKPEPVTQGLPPELYRIVYRSGEMTAARMGSAILSVCISEEMPGVFEAEGMDDIVKRFREYIKAPPALPVFEQYPMMYHCSKVPGSDSILRIIYRGAETAGANMSVSTRDNGGRLIRINRIWMLDILEEPLDILVRREKEWALYHMKTQCAFESSNWFFEQQGLIEKINKETGGYQNG